MKQILRPAIRILLLLLGLVLLYFGGVIGYAMLKDYEPPLQERLAGAKDSFQSRSIVSLDTISLLSWNLGFMGLGEESDFFYDGGESVYMPEAVVQKNRVGILRQLALWQNEVDFFLLQEVDRDSRRSYFQDQYALIRQQLPQYEAYFGTNYQVDFIPIPVFEPMGKVWSGLATYARAHATEASRYSFEGNYDWPTYLFFLDRCFLLTRYPLDANRELVLINTHNSAYDDGSLKQKQMKQLKDVLLAEAAKGNAVIVGGDWNQFPPAFAGVKGFALRENERDDRFFVPENYPATGWQWVADLNTPTNRSLNAPFNADTTRRYVIDYFLLSPNIEMLEVEGIDLNFKYSDHQPVKMRVAITPPESL